MVIEALRTMASELVRRYDLMSRGGKTFNGKRDMYEALGYKRNLFIEDYWERYLRGGLAKRAVDILPKATWRGGVYVFEKDDPNTETKFETEFDAMAERLSLWSYFERADRLSGVGEFSGLLIGAPGELETPLPRMSSTVEITMLKVYKQQDLDILERDYETDTHNPRYGMPNFYTIGGPRRKIGNKRVHWTRVIHIAQDILDDDIYGTPRLEAVWNLLDDLDKVTGGGAEAFWIRANNITQFDVDKDLQMKKDDESTKDLQEQVDELQHNIRRVIRTRGVEMNTMETKTADFKANAEAILQQICGTLEIPLRIFVGSERGEMASTQDRFNFSERIADRRSQYAMPQIVRPFVQRLVDAGALPKPSSFDVWWPEVKSLDPTERAKIAVDYSTLNKDANAIIVTTQEIRETISKEPLTEEMIQDELDLRQGEREVKKDMMPEFTPVDPEADPTADPANPDPKTLSRKRAGLVAHLRDVNSRETLRRTIAANT